MIKLYNTLTKTKEVFEPVHPRKVGIYLCGPTVYKPSHIGHMVGPIIFDTIKRFLVYNGFDVTLVINITDVDDKLIAEANARKTSMKAVADEMTADYKQNLRSMGIDQVDHFPKATDYMPNIIQFVEDLVAKGLAYESEGDVYFDVRQFPEYGKLSHRSLEQMLGEGGSTADRKNSGCDFALWKRAKPGEPFWDSPWGQGRPGWHIECSVMSCEILGETFDIHGGGLDLVFPHHENEIAQSEGRHGNIMAKYWLHNGLMQASSETGKLGGRKTRAANVGDNGTENADCVLEEGQGVSGTFEMLQTQEAGKISKSKGANAFRDLLERFAPDTIRFFILSSHYRRPIDFSMERIEQVETGLETFYRFFKRYERIVGKSFYSEPIASSRPTGAVEPDSNPFLQQVVDCRNKFLEMMDDDFNTGGGIGVLFDLLRILNKFADEQRLEEPGQKTQRLLDDFVGGVRVLRELCGVLGLFREPFKEKGTEKKDELVQKLMELIIELRANARKNKDFGTADKIRLTLAEVGIQIEDRPGQTEWTIK
ncbi:MAG: cysteine--tRNA ligase [Thermoguttaceae bacterium]